MTSAPAWTPRSGTRLLVSVRSAAEASVALAGGADVIDIKEPARGSLGAAETSVWRAVQRVVGDQAVQSAALGELGEGGIGQRLREAAGFCWVKVGLSRLGQLAAPRDEWARLCAALPAQVRLVPVVYADLARRDLGTLAAAVEQAAALAALGRGDLIVIDTFAKPRPLLLAADMADVAEAARAARVAALRLALAGSLDAAAIARLLPLEPAYVGVRGAACRGGRHGAVDGGLVKSLARLVRGAEPAAVGRDLT